MDRTEFSEIRRYLGKTQNEMARLLGASPKAVQSFEQGWRRVPVHAERQMLFYLSMKHPNGRRPCWEVRDCPEERKDRCPAWEFQSGLLCWFINGTMCQGKVQRTWQDKMELCRPCAVFRSMLPSTITLPARPVNSETPCP